MAPATDLCHSDRIYISLFPSLVHSLFIVRLCPTSSQVSNTDTFLLKDLHSYPLQTYSLSDVAAFRGARLQAMPLSPELSPTSETRSYPPYSPHCHLQHPDQAHWLTSASPIAKATSFSQPYASAKASASSSDSGSSRMESFRPHQPDITEQLFSDIGHPGQPIDNPLPHLHLSAFEQTTTWGFTSPYQMPCSIHENPAMLAPPSSFGGAYSNFPQTASRYSTPSMYDESPLQSPYFSSPDIAYAGFAGQPPRSLPIDDCDYDDGEEDPLGGKPYARLIFDALYQAPGHRMMLRDIYDWFEANTSKPRESGTNGWQNSIRHNLSMNHVRKPLVSIYNPL